MIKFTFFKRDGVYYGFEENGHAGYAESGDDIVCSAVSAMTMLIINAIEVAYASDVEYTINEDTTDIKVVARGALPEFEADERKRFAISGLIEAYFLQLNDMLEEYYDYLDVSEQEE
ncbi:MAG: ribosomal-processing cysteine protease Prp [Ruminococcaceae bacterium]|nr:ribosomal-processing cysteine protease Prp [Oscillospiraceae bacterium]